jgi:hypothetical protein
MDLIKLAKIDRLWKMRTIGLFDKLSDACVKYYSKKHKRFGMKIYQLCYSNGYKYNMTVYKGWRAEVRFPTAQDFSLHSVQTDSGAHAASIPVGYMELFPRGVKRQGREADHSPPSSAEVKNGGAIPPLPYMSWHSV